MDYLIKNRGKTQKGGADYSDELNAVFKTVRPLARMLIPYNQKMNLRSYEAKLSRKLIMAGRPGDLTPIEFIGLKEIFAVFFFFTFLMGAQALDQSKFTFGFAGLVFGYFFPGMDLRSTIARRQVNILRALPFDLDLLTLAVEAGLDFATALQKVVEKGRKSALTDEWALTLKEIRMGKTRKEALKALSERCNLPDLTSFVTSLILADQMGAGLGNVLRIQSDQLRRKRTQRAEELAQKAPVKMLFPLLAFIFPAVFIILFSPIILQFFVVGVGGK
jgi:tight adherence protein C